MIPPVFGRGETVRLNSGSPPLTVIECDLETVRVQWMQSAALPVASVRREEGDFMTAKKQQQQIRTVPTCCGNLHRFSPC